ncbi:rCG63208 [Rattus norvegicus]|uniref:RCG63208 n=1 Tax=Rattus norvegicus TaxID=10116 RepID=A6KDQ7_RAT|nr:rCG63208 [Rattus norvegicus]
MSLPPEVSRCHQIAGPGPSPRISSKTPLLPPLNYCYHLLYPGTCNH